MRLGIAATCTGLVVLVAGAALHAQFDRDRVIPGGGIFVPGWTGKIDASSARQGRMLNDGVFGLRFSHNVEAVITGFDMTKN